MRNMSFSLTTPQMRARTKDVTRRVGWGFLKPGDHFMAVEKGMGLKKGEKVVRLYECVCVSNTPEPVSAIAKYPDDCRREGFPELTPKQFAAMFRKHMKTKPRRKINRIEFKPVRAARRGKPIEISINTRGCEPLTKKTAEALGQLFKAAVSKTVAEAKRFRDESGGR